MRKDKSADVREPLLSITNIGRQFDEEETKESDEPVTISATAESNTENTESNLEEQSPTKSETSEVAVVSEK